jgi:ABC-type phosphate transport system substrate-binding protein
MAALNQAYSLRPCVRAIGTALVALSCIVARADIYVISHPDLNISSDQIKDIYTGEKQFAGNTRLTPVDNSTVQSVFFKIALKLDVARYNTLWIGRSFRAGHNPPTVYPSDTAVINFVRSAPGAVGYVTTQPVGVNIVHKY